MIRVTRETHAEYQDYLLKMFDVTDNEANDGKDKACLEYAYFVLGEWANLRFPFGDDYYLFNYLTENEVDKIKKILADKKEADGLNET